MVGISHIYYGLGAFLTHSIFLENFPRDIHRLFRYFFIIIFISGITNYLGPAFQIVIN